MHCTILSSVAQLDCVVVALLENVTGRKLKSAAGQTKAGIIERSLAATTTRMCLIRVMRALDRPDGAITTDRRSPDRHDYRSFTNADTS